MAALLLDTHVWLWLARGSPNLRGDRVGTIDAARHDLGVFVSVVSVLEVAMQSSRGRVELHMTCEEWVHGALSPQSIMLANLTPNIAIASTTLPGVLHGDPMDRIIVATARAMRATLVTHDHQLIAYGRAGHLDVMEV